MKQNRISLTSFAMQAGLGLGGFWVFKYIFIIAAAQYPALAYINTFLSFLTPLLLLFYFIKLKNEADNSKLAYWKGVRLGILIFLFASFIESVIVIVHIMWIDPTFISIINQQKLDLAQSLGFSETLMEELKKQTSFSPFVFVINQILNNVFIGFILSLIITPVASKIDNNIRNIDK